MPGVVSISAAPDWEMFYVNEFAYISFFSMKNVKFRNYISECCLASAYYCSIDDHAEVLILVISVLMNCFAWYFVQE
jgi:hypothetical protein